MVFMAKKNKFIKIRDVVMFAQAVNYDFNLYRFGYEIGQVPAHPKKFKANINLIRKAYNKIIKTNYTIAYIMGLIITGDQFIDNQNFQEIQEEFKNAIAVKSAVENGVQKTMSSLASLVK